MTFSLTAASTKPSGAMIRVRPGVHVGDGGHALHPTEVVDVGVRVDHRDHRAARPRCSFTSASDARAVSCEISGSTTIQPVSPAITDITDRS